MHYAYIEPSIKLEINFSHYRLHHNYDRNIATTNACDGHLWRVVDAPPIWMTFDLIKHGSNNTDPSNHSMYAFKSLPVFVIGQNPSLLAIKVVHHKWKMDTHTEPRVCHSCMSSCFGMQMIRDTTDVIEIRVTCDVFVN